MLKQTAKTISAKDIQLISAKVLEVLKKDKTLRKNKEVDWDFSAPATKTDIFSLKENINERVEEKIKERITKMEIKMVEIKSDTDKKMVEIKSDTDKKIVEMKNVLLQWILGLVTGYTLLLVALFKFFEK